MAIIHCLLHALYSCQSYSNNTKKTKKVVERKKVNGWNMEEQELKVLEEKLFFSVGNSDFQMLDSIISDKANLASAIIRDGGSEKRVIRDHYALFI